MAQKPSLPDDIKEMSFESALSEMEKIVDRLERGDVNLEDSIDIYTRGTQLKQHCEDKLRSAQEKIEKIVVDANGNVGSEPANIE